MNNTIELPTGRCERCGAIQRGPLDVEHVCRSAPVGPVTPAVGNIVAIRNTASAFYGRLAEVVEVVDREVYVRFLTDATGDLAMAFGMSEVVALAPGEVHQIFGR